MTQPLTDAINALTRYANETTGASDQTLSDAVETLVEGYGQGGGGLLTKLTEVIMSEDSRTCSIDVSEFADYDLLVLYTDCTMTQPDYLYTHVNVSEASVSGGYTPQRTNYKGTLVLSANNGNGYYMTATISDNNVSMTKTRSITNYFVNNWNPNYKMQAGTRFTVYGAKYAEM